VFACVGWQVTLCDPILQVTIGSSEMGFPKKNLSGFFKLSILLSNASLKTYVLEIFSEQLCLGTERFKTTSVHHVCFELVERNSFTRHQRRSSALTELQ